MAEDGIPSEFSLSQNYPNPFNPVTSIRYTLRTEARIRLVVFNPLGEEVAVLVDGRQKKSEHTVHVDTSGLPGMMYLYRITAGDFAAVRKMVLLK